MGMNRQLRKALKGLSDSDLERRRRAMERFVRSTFGIFIRYLYRYLGNEVECEDVLEDVYADIWENPMHLLDVTSEKQLIRQVYLYYMRDLLRKIYRQRNRFLHLSQKSLERLVAPNVERIDLMSEEELLELIHRMLNRLKANERKCIELWMEGLSNRAIANELKKTVDAVKMLKLRTFLKLRSMIGEYYQSS